MNSQKDLISVPNWNEKTNEIVLIKWNTYFQIYIFSLPWESVVLGITSGLSTVESGMSSESFFNGISHLKILRIFINIGKKNIGL